MFELLLDVDYFVTIVIREYVHIIQIFKKNRLIH